MKNKKTENNSNKPRFLIMTEHKDLSKTIKTNIFDNNLWFKKALVAFLTFDSTNDIYEIDLNNYDSNLFDEIFGKYASWYLNVDKFFKLELGIRYNDNQFFPIETHIYEKQNPQKNNSPKFKELRTNYYTKRIDNKEIKQSIDKTIQIFLDDRYLNLYVLLFINFYIHIYKNRNDVHVAAIQPSIFNINLNADKLYDLTTVNIPVDSDDLKVIFTMATNLMATNKIVSLQTILENIVEDTRKNLAIINSHLHYDTSKTSINNIQNYRNWLLYVSPKTLWVFDNIDSINRGKISFKKKKWFKKDNVVHGIIENENSLNLHFFEYLIEDDYKLYNILGDQIDDKYSYDNDYDKLKIKESWEKYIQNLLKESTNLFPVHTEFSDSFT